MIYVSGATGVTGSEVVRLLRSEGAQVRALAHHPEAAQTLEDLGAEVTLGDMQRPQTLAAGFDGVEALFLLSPPDPELAEMEGNLVDAAAAAGVQRVVKQSCSGVASDSPMVIGRAHADSEHRVEASGMAFTHLRPNGFMQNMLQNAPMIAVAGMIYAPMGDGHVSFVDARATSRLSPCAPCSTTATRGLSTT